MASEDIWQVETEVDLKAKTPREIYIGLLERMIEKLRESKPWREEDRNGRSRWVEIAEVALPTITFTEYDGEKKEMRITCFADRRDFLDSIEEEEGEFLEELDA